MKFNFVTGDLELIEEHTKDEKDAESVNSSDTLRNLVKSARIKQKPLGRAASTAETVKKSLETQIKSIIKSHSLKNEETNRKSTAKSNRRQKLLKQAENHSFKATDLVPIQALIQPSELKDPKAAAKAKIPVVKTKYKVKILKKPFSMKWLRNRRLSLFLQSDLYHEFKLALLLTQFEPINEPGLFLYFFICVLIKNHK